VPTKKEKQPLSVTRPELAKEADGSEKTNLEENALSIGARLPILPTMKSFKHRLTLSCLAGLLAITTSILLPNNSFAGEVSTLGVKVLWSDSLYEAPPTQRSTIYQFNFISREGVLISKVSIINSFGAVLNAAGLPTSFKNNPSTNSGSFNVIVFNTESNPLNWSGTKICLEVSLSGGKGTSSNCQPIQFLKQGPSAAPTSSPTPKVTTTAQPSPTPTVTVTAQPTQSATDRAVIEALSQNLRIIQSELKALKAKLKKICSSKPKPKGC
jgi:hypothetical protein